MTIKWREKNYAFLSLNFFQYWIELEQKWPRYILNVADLFLCYFCFIFNFGLESIWFFYICFLTEKNSSNTTITASCNEKIAMKIKNAIWNVMGDTYQGRTTQIASYDIFTSLSVFIEKINMWQTPSIPLDFESCCWRILRAFFCLHLLISI